jgi:hypothetical protein
MPDSASGNGPGVPAAGAFSSTAALALVAIVVAGVGLALAAVGVGSDRRAVDRHGGLSEEAELRRLAARSVFPHPHQAWTRSLVLATRTAVPISQIARPAWAGKRAANATSSVRASTGPAAA